MDLDKKETNISKKTRTILWYLMFTGFIFDGMIRTSMSITIVDMVLDKPQTNNKCLSSNESVLNNTPIIKERYSIERLILDALDVGKYFNFTYKHKRMTTFLDKLQ